MRAASTRRNRRNRCSHEQTIASSVAGMERLVCAGCGQVNVKLVSDWVTRRGIPTPRYEVDSQ